MQITLSPKITKEASGLMHGFGYRDVEDFVSDAVQRQILYLKKIDFLSTAEKIRTRMQDKGLTEEKILEDFDKFRRG